MADPISFFYNDELNLKGTIVTSSAAELIF